MEFARYAEDLLASALAIQLFLITAALMVLRALSRSDVERSAPWFYAAAAFLALRDLLSALLPGVPVLLPSAALFPFFLLLAALPRERRTAGTPLLAYAALAVACAALSAYLGAGGSAAGAALAALAPSAGAAFFVFSGPAEKVQTIALSGRVALIAAMALPPAAALVVGGPVLGRFVLPLSYLALLAAELGYARTLENRLLAERDTLTENIDTLYGFVLRASDSLRGSPDLNRLLVYVAETLRTETESDGAMVLMVDDFEDSVSARAVSGSFAPVSVRPADAPRTAAGLDEWLSNLKVPLGEGLIGTTAQSGKAALIRDAAADERVSVDPANPISGAIAVPFLIDDRVIGVGVVVRRLGTAPYEDGNFDRASLLADFASLVINNVYSFQETSEKGEIDREAAIAADIQKALQPKRIADLPGAAFGAFSVPARGVSSDYFDVILARRNKVYLVAGDVAGKGVPASLIMVMIRAILHLVTNTEQDTATILKWINRGITGKIDLDHFATLQILAYDASTGECEYANAGHRPPLVWRQGSGLVDALELGSVPIGVEKNTDFKSTKFVLEDGDIMVLYTDGVVEAVNQSGKQYGMKSLTTMLHKFHELPVKEIANKVSVDLKAFMGSARQHDDQTLLAMKVKR